MTDETYPDEDVELDELTHDQLLLMSKDEEVWEERFDTPLNISQLQRWHDYMHNPCLFINGADLEDWPTNKKYQNWRTSKWGVFDIETDGLPLLNDWTKTINPDFRVLSFYGEVYDNRSKTDELSLMFDPGKPIDPSSTNIHGITDEMVEGKPTFDDKWIKIWEFFEQVDIIVAYNGIFDVRALLNECARNNIEQGAVEEFNKPLVDLLVWERHFSGKFSRNKLEQLCSRYGVKMMAQVKHGETEMHDASVDVQALAKLMMIYMNRLPYSLNQTVQLQSEYYQNQYEYLRNKYE